MSFPAGLQRQIQVYVLQDRPYNYSNSSFESFKHKFTILDGTLTVLNQISQDSLGDFWASL